MQQSHDMGQDSHDTLFSVIDASIWGHSLQPVCVCMFVLLGEQVRLVCECVCAPYEERVSEAQDGQFVFV